MCLVGPGLVYKSYGLICFGPETIWTKVDYKIMGHPDNEKERYFLGVVWSMGKSRKKIPLQRGSVCAKDAGAHNDIIIPHLLSILSLQQSIMAEKLSDGSSIVSVNPKPSKGFSSRLVDLLERLVLKLMHDASLPLHYLSGNFAPLRDETPPVKDLPVHGFLPVSSTTSLLYSCRRFIYMIVSFVPPGMFEW